MAYKTGGPRKRPALTRIVAFLGALGLVAAAGPAKAAPVDTGQWSPVHPLPIVPIHDHVLPDGKILFWQDDNAAKVGSPSANNSVAYVVDVPTDGAPGTPAFVPNNETDLFCAGHAFLPTGDLLVIGGQELKYYQGVTTTTLFHASTNQWETLKGSEMRERRWYPTTIPLATGEILAIGGTTYENGDRNLIPEVWRTSGGWRSLTTASLSVPPYSWVFQAPNGKVLFAGPKGSSRYLDIAGTGKWSAAPARKVGDRVRGAAVMYDTGKILLVGGNGAATAETIDLLAAAPAWKAMASMRNARIYHHATVLPDGTVLVTGGTNSSGPVLAAELWNPATNTWTTLASAQIGRGYHSAGFLLPDGRVWSGGGGRKAKLVDQKNAEIFSPPYLFKGPRPTIGTAPASSGYGQTIQVGTPQAADIAKVSLIKLSSVTHSFNMGQRFNALKFTKGANALSVTTPANTNLAPPGHYLLFVVSSAGVPSAGKIIRLS
jgi:hypothetical protein